MTAALSHGVGVALPRRRLRTKACVTLLPVVVSPTESVQRTPEVAPAAASAEAEYILRERHPEYVVVQSAFDKDLLEQVRQFLKRKRPQPAKMKNEGGDSDDERKARYNDRDSRVSWFNAQAECLPLHERLVDLTRRVGNKEWPMLKVDTTGRLQCEFEDTQYALYGPDQHFKAWHQDAYEDGNDPEDARQITVVTMLSDRGAYTAGMFQAKVSGSSGKKVVKSVKLEAGDALIFPAKRLIHRVSTVKTGLRKTLVSWAFDRASCKYHTSRGLA